MRHEERTLFLQLSSDTGWKECLELVAKLVKANGSKGLLGVLPPVDHGRVKFFCKFWGGNFEASPPWLKNAVQILKQAEEQPREGKGLLLSGMKKMQTLLQGKTDAEGSGSGSEDGIVWSDDDK